MFDFVAKINEIIGRQKSFALALTTNQPISLPSLSLSLQTAKLLFLSPFSFIFFSFSLSKLSLLPFFSCLHTNSGRASLALSFSTVVLLVVVPPFFFPTPKAIPQSYDLCDFRYSSFFLNFFSFYILYYIYLYIYVMIFDLLCGFASPFFFSIWVFVGFGIPL